MPCKHTKKTPRVTKPDDRNRQLKWGERQLLIGALLTGDSRFDSYPPHHKIIERIEVMLSTQEQEQEKVNERD